jgi:aminomethyltransferase
MAFTINVKIMDPEVWVSQIQGPLSMELLSKLIEGSMPNPWNYFDWAEVMIGGQKVIISRTGFTNELGWEIYIRPENDIEKLGDLILESGKSLGMILTATPGFRARRIEAGLLSAGADFDYTTTPFTVGLGRYIDFNKDDFIGREALLKADKQSRCWGTRVEDGIALRGRHLEKNGVIRGRVTSSSWSPYQECGIGIVLLDEPNGKPGNSFQIRCNDGEMHLAEICDLPMYDENREIVRGKKIDIPQASNPWKPSQTV